MGGWRSWEGDVECQWVGDERQSERDRERNAARASSDDGVSYMLADELFDMREDFQG
jgi:hypothetical protein